MATSEQLDQFDFLSAFQKPEVKPGPIEIDSSLSAKVRELEVAKDLLDYICTTFKLERNQEELKKRFPELLDIINKYWLPRYETIRV